ncbi:hypothetical protein ACIA48_29950 [Mycobacterium sp. NPDC051804]|uniref:hypothetical protein n=1 Tax=Mycobacterium sp. NPDC051804 TaxID=3364295 RepID=UPI003798BF7C
MPLCLTVTPFRETATFLTGFGALAGFAAALPAESADEDVSEVGDGLANANPGAEINPTPMPNATASAPTRPM